MFSKYGSISFLLTLGQNDQVTGKIWLCTLAMTKMQLLRLFILFNFFFRFFAIILKYGFVRNNNWAGANTCLLPVKGTIRKKI